MQPHRAREQLLFAKTLISLLQLYACLSFKIIHLVQSRRARELLRLTQQQKVYPLFVLSIMTHLLGRKC